MSIVAYLGHPLGEKDLADMWDNSRRDNVANSLDWLKFLRHTTRWAICYPVVAYMAAVDDLTYQPRSFVDRLAILMRCDVYVMVGGMVNPHMRYELSTARRRLLPVIDLVHLGRVPPWDRQDEVSQEIASLENALRLTEHVPGGSIDVDLGDVEAMSRFFETLAIAFRAKKRMRVTIE